MVKRIFFFLLDFQVFQRDSGATPGGTKKSRWDETPVAGLTPLGTPGGIHMTPGGNPLRNKKIARQKKNFFRLYIHWCWLGTMISAEKLQAVRWEKEMEYRNRPLSDADLDAMLPSSGYKILEPPATYVPIRSAPAKVKKQTTQKRTQKNLNFSLP